MALWAFDFFANQRVGDLLMFFAFGTCDDFSHRNTQQKETKRKRAKSSGEKGDIQAGHLTVVGVGTSDPDDVATAASLLPFLFNPRAQSKPSTRHGRSDSTATGSSLRFTPAGARPYFPFTAFPGVPGTSPHPSASVATPLHD